MVWTQFWDIHSGGRQKLPYAFLYIEAPKEEAEIIFYNKFGRTPYRVTCTCCGEDYSVTEYITLEDATAFHRGCTWVTRKDGEGKYVNPSQIPDGYKADYPPLKEYKELEDYINQDDVFVLEADYILPEDREGSIPRQGCVWMD